MSTKRPHAPSNPRHTNPSPREVKNANVNPPPQYAKPPAPPPPKKK